MWFLANDVPCTIAGNEIDIPGAIAGIIATVVNLIKIVVPIILIILGMLDMGKAVASQKEDEIKKGQKTLMSRCIAAGIVFFVVAIVQLLISIVTKSTSNDATSKDTTWSCVCKLIGASGCE